MGLFIVVGATVRGGVIGGGGGGLDFVWDGAEDWALGYNMILWSLEIFLIFPNPKILSLSRWATRLYHVYY